MHRKNVSNDQEEERTRIARSFREMERDGSGDFNLAPVERGRHMGTLRRVGSWDHPESHLVGLSGETN